MPRQGCLSEQGEQLWRERGGAELGQCRQASGEQGPCWAGGWPWGGCGQRAFGVRELMGVTVPLCWPCCALRRAFGSSLHRHGGSPLRGACEAPAATLIIEPCAHQACCLPGAMCPAKEELLTMGVSLVLWDHDSQKVSASQSPWRRRCSALSSEGFPPGPEGKHSTVRRKGGKNAMAACRHQGETGCQRKRQPYGSGAV